MYTYDYKEFTNSTFISISSAVFGGVLRAFSAIFSNSSHKLKQINPIYTINFIPKFVIIYYFNVPLHKKIK